MLKGLYAAMLKAMKMAPEMFKKTRYDRGNKPGKSEGLLKNYAYYNKGLWRISKRETTKNGG